VVTALKSLSVLLVWHGNVLVGTTVMDTQTCYQAAEKLSASGSPSACIDRSCVDLILDSQPGWQVKCQIQDKESSRDQSKKTPGVM